MIRKTYETLETLAYAKRRPIEIDAEQNIAVVKIGRDTFYATLPAPVVDADVAETRAG